MAGGAVLAAAALCLSVLPSLIVGPAESRVLTVSGGCQEQFAPRARVKRQAAAPLYIELVLVADHSFFLHHGGDLASIQRYCHAVAEHVDRVYASLNIRVALADVVVWSRGDEMDVVSDANVTLRNFAQYRRSSRTLAAIPHDNAHLLTKRGFDKGTVGMGYVLDSICAHDWSCGVLFAFDEPARAASALAHELGHNLGMHDERAAGPCKASCGSPAGCVMDTGAGDAWSDCSREVTERYFGLGHSCLRNQPRKYFQVSTPEILPPPPRQSSILPSAWGVDSDNDILASTSIDLHVLLVMDETTTRRERTQRGNTEKYYGLSLIKAVNYYFTPLGVKVHLTDTVSLSLDLESSIVDVRSVNRTLVNFRNHMQDQRDTMPDQYHVAILMSNAVYVSQDTSTTGSSWIGGACSAGHQVGVVSTGQRARSVGITLAHELAHLLGLRHDGDAAPASGCPDRSGRHIMASVIGDHTDPRLSRCSVNAWNDGLKTTFADCLRFSHSKRASNDESNEVGDLASNTAITEKLVVVRVLLVVGESTYRKYGGQEYCNRLMQTVRTYYLALGIDLQRAGVKYVNSYVEKELVNAMSASSTLKAFNKFASKLHHATKEQFHIAVLLSEHSYPYINKGVADSRYTIKGRSIPGEVCRPESGNAIVSSEQRSEALTALTLAHELGHVLGMSDDGKRVEGVASCPSGGGGRIMSGSLRDDLVPDWSECSRDTWRTFYMSDSARCLWDESIPKAMKRPQHSSGRAPSDQIQDLHVRAPTTRPPTRVQQSSESSGESVARRPQVRKMRVKLLLVFGNSTLAARGENAYSRGRDLVEAVDSYFAPLGVTVELAGWARLDSSVETQMNMENLYDFQRIVRRGKLKKGLPKHYIAILVSHLAFSSPDELGKSFSAGACSREKYMGIISSRHEAWRSEVALAQQVARLLGIGDEALMRGVPGCPEPPAPPARVATPWSECSVGTLKAAREMSLLDCLE